MDVNDVVNYVNTMFDITQQTVEIDQSITVDRSIFVKPAREK